MMFIKTLAVFITIFGLAALGLGIAGLLVVEMSVETMQAMRAGGYPAPEGVDLDTFQTVLYVNSLCFIVSGVLSLIGGIGIFLGKNWARLLWLGTLTFLTLWTIYSSVMSLINRGFETGLIWNAIILLIYLAMFYFFSRWRTKERFLRNSYAA